MNTYDRFLKNSVWEFTEDAVIGGQLRLSDAGTNIVAGSQIKIKYPRRNSSDQIAISGVNFSFPKRKKAYGRYSHADIIVAAQQLDAASKLVSLDERYQHDYYLRQKSTGDFWSSTMKNGTPAYTDVFQLAYFCMSHHNAIIQIMSTIFATKKADFWPRGECPIEIVQYDPIGKREVATHQVEEDWYNNIRNLAIVWRHNPRERTQIRSLASALNPRTGRLIGWANFYSNTADRFFREHESVRYHSYNNHFAVFDSLLDLKLCRVYLGDEVEIGDFN